MIRLNKMTIRGLRRDKMYEAIMTDLVLMGALDKATVESFTGYKISGELLDTAGQKPSIVPVPHLDYTDDE